MQQRHWLAAALSVGLMLAIPALAVAQGGAPAAAPEPLPQACVDAGATTPEACTTLLAKQKAEKAAADKAAADKAAADKAAADKAAADKAAADKAAAEKAAAEKAAADKAAAEKAAAEKAAAEKAAADKAAAEKAAADKAAADKAAANKAAADKAAADKAAAEKAAAEKAAADKAAADKAAADKAAAEKAAADKAAADKAAAEKAAAAPAAQAAPAVPAPKLPKACLAAGMKTPADCDAFLAKQKGDKAAAEKAAADKAAADKAAADKAAADKAAADKAAADKAAADKAAAEKTPAAVAPPAGTAPATTTAPAPNGQAPAQPATLPAEVTPPKTEKQPPAAQPAAATPALPDIEGGLTEAAKAYNRAVGVLAKAGNKPAAVDKAKAEIKTQEAKMLALCKTNQFDSVAQCLAQYGIQLAPLPTGEAAGVKPPVTQPVQPVEVIDKLPQGVTKQEVAPLLDSAKDQKAGNAPAQLPAPNQPAAPAVAQPPINTPPPSNDKAAQAKLQPQKIVPIDQQQGQAIAAGAPKVEVPQNVTIINQTINNTNVTNTTNNTQNNNGPGVQQNNAGAPGAQQPAGRPGKPGVEPNGTPNRPGPNETQPNPIGLGLQVILQLGNQLIINSPGMDQQRIADHPQDRTTYEQLPNGRYRETILRTNGVRIVTIYNRNGDILRRSRFDRDGHETVLAYFDDRYDSELSTWRDPGRDLPPLQLHIPARDYVLDADQANEGEVQRFFAQPPVEQVQRLYSIDEVKRSARIRDMVRRLEIGDLTFDTGAATISEDQVANLSKVAQAMLALLKKNPAETFLIEGHTDAVGSDISNLKLSDARAGTVAQILTDFYHIPPENLATQGYGERYLKVQTDGPERLNRRVTIRRITPLVTVATQNY